MQRRNSLKVSVIGAFTLEPRSIPSTPLDSLILSEWPIGLGAYNSQHYATGAYRYRPTVQVWG